MFLKTSRPRTKTQTKEGNLDDYGLNGVKGARSKEPVPFEPLHLKDVKVVEIATGDNHILALDDQGRVWSFGADSQSCLGRPAVPILRQSTRIKAGNIAADQIDDFERALQPALVDGLKNIVSIACGSYCSYAIDKAGTVYAWGENGNGQLVPVPSFLPTLVEILHVSIQMRY